jgi:hypothetical protein
LVRVTVEVTAEVLVTDGRAVAPGTGAVVAEAGAPVKPTTTNAPTNTEANPTNVRRQAKNSMKPP